MDLVLNILVDMGLNWVFSDPSCRHTWPRGGSGFKQIGRHGFELGVLRSSVDIQGLEVDLDIIRLLDMSVNGLFSDPVCRHVWAYR